MQDKITILFDKYSIVHHSCQNVVHKVSIDKFDSEVFLQGPVQKEVNYASRVNIHSDCKHLICFLLSSKTTGSYKSSKIDKDAGNFGSKIQFPSEKWIEVLSHAGQLHICSFLLEFLSHSRMILGDCQDGKAHV